MKSISVINLGLGIVSVLVLWATLAPGSALALPPRPEDVVSTEKDDGDDDSLLGAYIELHVQLAPMGSWAIVQWRDGAGGWQNVEGWRSQIDSPHIISWWVGPKDLRTGPFRWVVYSTQARGGLVWSSQPFYLPKQGETLRIAAAVPMPSTSESTGFTAIPPESRPPEILFPVTGRGLDVSSNGTTTAFSIIVTLLLLVAGVEATFRNGSVT